eukprot:scaffold132263_cov53-Prasinocladus_malaysianus.AAC.1
MRASDTSVGITIPENWRAVYLLGIPVDQSFVSVILVIVFYGAFRRRLVQTEVEAYGSQPR